MRVQKANLTDLEKIEIMMEEALVSGKASKLMEAKYQLNNWKKAGDRDGTQVVLPGLVKQVDEMLDKLWQ